MQRNRFPSLRRRAPRRGGHPPGFGSNCIKLTPPIDDPEGFIGFCLDLKLWRVRVGGFDRFGPVDDERAIGFREAIDEAADFVREGHPEHAARLDAISEALESD